MNKKIENETKELKYKARIKSIWMNQMVINSYGMHNTQDSNGLTQSKESKQSKE